MNILRLLRRGVLSYFQNSRRKPHRFSARGETYDLEQIRQSLQCRYFATPVDVVIRWSRSRRVGRRSIQFGCYDSRLRQIRIHRSLDSAQVPLFFVEFVVYHEMLHAVHGPQRSASGRRCIHTPEFRRCERLHPDFDAATAYRKHFLPKRGTDSWQVIANGRTPNTEKNGPTKKKGKFSAGS